MRGGIGDREERRESGYRQCEDGGTRGVLLAGCAALDRTRSAQY